MNRTSRTIVRRGPQFVTSPRLLSRAGIALAFSVPAEQISETRVLETILGGQVVYRASPAEGAAGGAN